MHFVEQKKVLAKNEAKQKGNTHVPTYANGGFFFYLIFYLFKSNIKFASTNVLLTKQRQKYNRQSWWKRRFKLNLLAACPVNFLLVLCFVSLNKFFWVPITEYGLRKEGNAESQLLFQ